MELKMTVEKGFLVAEYSEEAKKEENVCVTEEYPIGSIFEHKGKYYLVCEEDGDEDCNGCKGCYLSENCAPLDYTRCHSSDRKDAKSVVYKEIKDGDFCIASNSCSSRIIFIYRLGGVGNNINHYATDILVYFDYLVSTRPIRMATEEEKQILLDAIHKDGKDWDANNKQIVDYVEPIEVGDICILWDNYKSDAIIAAVTYISLGCELPYTTKTDGYRNAVKFTSLEQYQQFIEQ